MSIEVGRLNRKWGEVKLPGLGWVRFRCSRWPNGDIRHATVMRTPLGWEMSLCVEDGKAAAPGREARAGGRLERRLARQRTGSRQRSRSKRELARARARDGRRRLDCLHKLTASLVRENALIAIEDLKVRSMTRSARGTVEAPGVNVVQKAGLNRSAVAARRALSTDGREARTPDTRAA